MADRVLTGLGDGHAEAAWRVGVLGQDGLAGLGTLRWAGEHLRPELHHGAAVWLLVVAHLHHVHRALEAKVVAGERQGAAPLAGARLGGEALHAGLFVVVGLRHGRVRLVRAGRAHALVLVEDPGRRVEGLLEGARPDQGCRPPQLVDLAHLIRDFVEALGRGLLHDQAQGEERRQILGPGELLGAGMQRRRRWLGEVRHDVVPGPRDPLFAQQIHLRHGAPPSRFTARRHFSSPFQALPATTILPSSCTSQRPRRRWAHRRRRRSRRRRPVRRGRHHR